MLAVVAVLALMAIPGLQDAALKKQVKEGMALAAIATTGVQLAYSVSGTMPADNAEAGIPVATKIVGALVKAVTVEGGAVTITYGNNASKGLDGKQLTLRPAIVAGETRVPIAWICAKVGVPNGMELRGADKTDIPSSWLPVDCRPSGTK